MTFDNAVKLLDNVELLHLGCEILDDLYGQRIGHSYLHHACRVAHYFLNVEVGRARGDDSDLIGVIFNCIELAIFSESAESLGSRLDHGVTLDSVTGHHYVLSGLLYVILESHLFSARSIHDGAAVGDSRAHTKDNGSVIFLGKGESRLCILISLRGICGLEHRHLCRYGIVS